MGYYIEFMEGNIKIKKENMKPLLETVVKYFEDGNNLRFVDSFDKEYIESTNIRDIWCNLRYRVIEENDYYVITNFLGEKYGSDCSLFDIIAHYCEDGYLQFRGEEGGMFRFVIKDNKFKEVYPELSWD